MTHETLNWNTDRRPTSYVFACVESTSRLVKLYCSKHLISQQPMHASAAARKLLALSLVSYHGCHRSSDAWHDALYLVQAAVSMRFANQYARALKRQPSTSDLYTWCTIDVDPGSLLRTFSSTTVCI